MAHSSESETIKALRHIYSYLEGQAYSCYTQENGLYENWYAPARNYVHNLYVDACYESRGLVNPRLAMTEVK